VGQAKKRYRRKRKKKPKKKPHHTKGKGNKVSKSKLLDPLTRKADHMVSFILVI